ncbi:fumarylacetoacetate hydrolase family protein [Halorarum halophilum]|uniref:Fumarylacetoacetate hydrolase family protein n=1 Tax=Halorarum halophilum TaxID=2743090 RepID=A0A7D5GXI0_9EURY|nr:fumarylacetoacetate hydrolase family protein [Halobaculum halophilum]QLG27809.1 fumarylacetoacetate hydrolase family protein [Halobaculum halophilum]
MQYYQVDTPDVGLVVRADDRTYDLGTSDTPVESFRELANASRLSGTGLTEITERLTSSAEELPATGIEDDLVRPLSPDEVWAAGVTYEISEAAREEESDRPDVYMDVYNSDRPELFFKATASRTVGPGEQVGIRSDSTWDVPEPELGIVLYRGETVGYTIGNDMSSRSIEGENPLFLPQAKVYDRCCSLGPGITPVDAVPDPHDLTMNMTITRDGESLYDDGTSTAKMHRTCEELVSYFTRHNAVPELAVLMTGTSLVPEDDFTLREGDTVTISIDSLGELVNEVTVV